MTIARFHQITAEHLSKDARVQRKNASMHMQCVCTHGNCGIGEELFSE
jgi:hypothetical protein